MYEQDADRVADTVMRMPEPGVQRQEETEEKEETYKAKKKKGQTSEVTTDFESQSSPC